jgi:ribonuclease VapC
MFVDASAIVAILGSEDDGPSLAARLAQAGRAFISPIVLYESVAGLARRRVCPIADATALVDGFVEETEAQMVEITAAIGRAALDAFERYGRGRHVADLNLGDCFAYACARSVGEPLLCKGNDFVHTDIEIG